MIQIPANKKRSFVTKSKGQGDGYDSVFLTYNQETIYSVNFLLNFTKQQGSGQEDGRDPVFSGGASEPGEEAQEAGQIWQ